MRDRLIELLKNAKGECLLYSSDGCLACSYQGEENCTLENLADHLIENGVTVQEWISVKDRLPEKDGYYIAFVEGYWARCTRLLGFAKDGRKVDEFDFDEGAKNVWYRYDSEYGYVTVEDVTHWMPLPQPPKGE